MFRVIKFGGSLGDINHPKDCETKEEAQAYAKAWKNSYSPAARKYYGVRYRIKEIKQFLFRNIYH